MLFSVFPVDRIQKRTENLMKEKYQKQIEREFRTCVEDTISRIQESDETYRPFHPALLSKEALFWSRFERSFSTSFGQRTIG